MSVFGLHACPQPLSLSLTVDLWPIHDAVLIFGLCSPEYLIALVPSTFRWHLRPPFCDLDPVTADDLDCAKVFHKQISFFNKRKQTNKEHTQNTTTKAKEKKRRKISKIKPLFTPHQPANGDCDFYMLSKGMFMNASKFYNYPAVCLSASLSFRQSVCSCISLPVLSQSGDGGILSYEPPSIKTLVIGYHKKKPNCRRHT